MEEVVGVSLWMSDVLLGRMPRAHCASPGLSVAARWKRRQVYLVRSCIFKPHNGINHRSPAA